MTAPVPTDLERGRAHFRDRAWDDAYQTLARADAAESLAIDDLERFAAHAARAATVAAPRARSAAALQSG